MAGTGGVKLPHLVVGFAGGAIGRINGTAAISAQTARLQLLVAGCLLGISWL